MTSRQVVTGISALATALYLAGCASAPLPRHEELRGAASDSSVLYQTVVRLDDSLSAAFNAHDLDRLMALFSSDLEFYHDTGGLQSFAIVKAGFGELFSQNNGIRRERVGPLRVFPIRNYGAVELGTHRFCHNENGRADCGTFEFAQLWKQQGSEWKIARVISYGH
jgi:hypothetical protein